MVEASQTDPQIQSKDTQPTSEIMVSKQNQVKWIHLSSLGIHNTIITQTLGKS